MTGRHRRWRLTRRGETAAAIGQAVLLGAACWLSLLTLWVWT